MMFGKQTNFCFLFINNKSYIPTQFFHSLIIVTIRAEMLAGVFEWTNTSNGEDNKN